MAIPLDEATVAASGGAAVLADGPVVVERVVRAADGRRVSAQAAIPVASGAVTLAPGPGAPNLGTVERLLLVVVLVAVAVAVAFVLQRRRPRPAPTNVGYTLPAHVDRGDFDRPEAPWLVAVFTSATCSTCAGVWEKAPPAGQRRRRHAGARGAATRPLHQRYHVNAVPSVVVADAGGVVRATFVGPVTATDLWASVAELREPGLAARRRLRPRRRAARLPRSRPH